MSRARPSSARSARALFAIALPILLLGSGCSATRSGAEVNALLAQSMASVELRLTQGEAMEAYELATAVAAVDPEYPGVQEALQEVPEEMASIFDRPLLGSNVALRQPVSSPWWVHVLLYVPDRILDVLDIVSFDVHFGIGVYGDVHATRAIQAAGGFRSVGGLGWNEQRSLGLKSQTGAGLSAAFAGAETYTGSLTGTSGVRVGSWGVAGLHLPTDGLYQEFKDYWAIGASATAGIVGAGFDVHPVQIVDLLAGIVLLDPLNDDFASTRGLAYSKLERELMRELAATAVDGDALVTYLLWKETQIEPVVEDIVLEPVAEPAVAPIVELPVQPVEPPAEPVDLAPFGVSGL